MCNPQSELRPIDGPDAPKKNTMNIQEYIDLLANFSGAKTFKNPANLTIVSAKSHVLKPLNLTSLVLVT
jgi:hypothetical protein